MLDPNTERAAAEFIKKAVDSGYGEREIRESFLKKGYPIDEVDGILNKYLHKEVSAEHHYARYIFIVAGVLLLVFIIVWLVPGGKRCNTQECFINNANNCKESTLKQLEEGSVFTYEIKKKDGECVLIKTATDISESEGLEVRELEGKSMECSFFKGNFNTDWINYLTKDIDGCYGELRDLLETVKNSDGA